MMSSASSDGRDRDGKRAALDSDETRPLVSCRVCGSAWYGAAVAHGLSVLGHCSRCGGALCFADWEAGVSQDASASEPGDHREPWQVLGRPGR